MIDLHDLPLAATAECDVDPAPAFNAEAAPDAAVLQRVLADALGRLGPVLWLERPGPAPVHAPDPHRGPRAAGLAAAAIGHAVPGAGPQRRGAVHSPELPAFQACAQLDAHVSMTAVGPREWLCLCDAHGHSQAKLFLLPDSDYLAWDQMLAACGLTPARAAGERRRSACDALLRSLLARGTQAWRARVVHFQLRRLPWRWELRAQAPLRVSLLGHELATHIARDEGAEWVRAFRID